MKQDDGAGEQNKRLFGTIKKQAFAQGYKSSQPGPRRSNRTIGESTECKVGEDLALQYPT